jgi:[ribosomal protein S5]-alanine N-acetyltransferase
MAAPPVLIEGVRLRLVRATPDDAATLFALVDDAQVMQFMDWPRAGSVDDTRRHLEAMQRAWATGSEHQYLIQAKPGGAALGSISFRRHPPGGPSADFGYLLGRAHWGHGYATEAAALLLGWLQRQREVVRVWATCDAHNTRSAAVLERAGLQREGLLRRATLRPNVGGGPRDTLMYAWVREEAPTR